MKPGRRKRGRPGVKERQENRDITRRRVLYADWAFQGPYRAVVDFLNQKDIHLKHEIEWVLEYAFPAWAQKMAQEFSEGNADAATRVEKMINGILVAGGGFPLTEKVDLAVKCAVLESKVLWLTEVLTAVHGYLDAGDSKSATEAALYALERRVAETEDR